MLLFSSVAYYEVQILDAPLTSRWNVLAARAVSWPLSLIETSTYQTENVVSYGAHAVEIVSDCTGVDLFGIFVAATLAFPATLRQRLRGIALGLPILVGLNFVRLFSLTIVQPYSETAFSWGHLYVWPALVLTAALAIWLYWATTTMRHEDTLV